jgi:hypothetical protein
VGQKYADCCHQIVAMFYFVRIIILRAVLCCVGLKLGLSQSGSGFEVGVMRKIFGPKGDELTAYWRELQNEELRDLC